MLPITPPPKVRSDLADGVPRVSRAVSATRRAAREPGERALPAEQVRSRRTAGAPRRDPRPRRTPRGITFRGFDPSASIDRRSVDRVDRPLARLEVRDHRVEHLARRGRSSSTLVPRLGRDRERRRRRRTGSPSGRRAARASTARSWPMRDRVRERPRGRTRRRSAPAPAGATRATSSSSVEPADPLAVQPVELLLGRRPAAACVTRSRSNAATSSSSVEHLVAVVGRRPAEQREVVDERLGEVARGRGSPRPRPRRGASTAWPRSASTIERQVRVHRRRRRRRARARSASTRWVESMRSSPRITWVIPMSRSSTALARKKIGEPSERTITKSWIVRPLDAAPRRGSRSVKLLTPVVGGAEPDRARPTLGRERARARRRRGRGSGRRSPAGARRPSRRRCARFDLVLGAVALVGVALRRAGGRRRRGTRSKRVALAGTGPRPSRGRASAACPGSRRPTPRGCGRRRCPRCGARTCRRACRANSQLNSAVRALPTWS